MWGPDLLDPDEFAHQQRTAAKAANPWGPDFGLPGTEPAPVEPRDGAVASTVPADAAPVEAGLSIATIEQRLATDPEWWGEALELELKRQAPRKGALRAIIKTMELEAVDATTIAKVRDVLAEV